MAIGGVETVGGSGPLAAVHQYSTCVSCTPSFCVVGAQADGLRLFEIACVPVRLDHVAAFIVNANHRIM
jgi:hypothetical protein